MPTGTMLPESTIPCALMIDVGYHGWTGFMFHGALIVPGENANVIFGESAPEAHFSVD